MQGIFHDIRYALRQLRKSPGFTLVAVVTLALGIGANTAMASGVYALLLRSLPFHDAEQLVLIRETHPQAGTISASYQDFLDWRARSKSFQGLAAYSDVHHANAQVVIADQPQSVRTALASAELFPTLGIAPELGRGFLPAEDSDSGIHVAVISHRLWESRFAGDRLVIGRAVEINGQPFTIAGVMPAGAQYPVETDLWLPLAQLDPNERSNRQYHAVDVIGRLRPGTTNKEASLELNTIAAQLAQSYPVTNRSIGAKVTPIREALVGQLRPTLLILFASVALVLFIACANIANLLMVRGRNREREIAIRTALGATHARLLRQFLAEGLILSALGTLAGLLFAVTAIPVLNYGLARVTDQPFSATLSIGLSLPVLMFTSLLAVLTGILFSLVPSGAGFDINDSLRAGTRTFTAGRKPIRSILAAGEVALAVVVLFTAVLLLRSWQKLLAVDPGFRTDHLLAVKLDLPARAYGKPEQVEAFSTRLQERIARLPGVASVAITNALPLRPSKSLTRFAVQGAPPPAPGNFPVTQLRFVSPSYFQTLGIGLRAGRMFEPKDVDDPGGTFIVNQAFARRYLSGREAVGSRLMMDVTTPHPIAVPIVGVVSDATDLGVDAGTAPVIYTAGYPNGQTVLVRTRLDPLALAPEIRQTVSSLDRNLGVSDVTTMDGVLADSLARPRLSSVLLSFFALLSLGLAAMGVYGVLAFAVTQRTREIGVRMALGARREQVLALFMKEGAVLVFSGAAIGIAAGFVVARLMAAVLFQTAPADPLSLGATLLLLIMTGLIAVLVPAQRASRINPVDALLSE